MKHIPSRPSPAMVVACIALIVALGGTGYAAVKLPRNSVGARQLKSNAVTSPKVKDGSLAAKDFAAGQLPRGPQGPEGPAGAKGDKGDKGDAGGSGTALWAVINAAGTLRRGSGVTNVAHSGPGSAYVVTFTRDVSQCAAVATPAAFNGGYPSVSQAVVSQGGSIGANQFGVAIFNNAAAFQEGDIMLAVFC